LTELCGGNVHAKGLVAISCSSNERNQCWDVVNYDWNKYWFTSNSPNSWIQFDFKDQPVSLSHYALKSDGNGDCHLLQWALQGSVDRNSWTDLDRRNTQELNRNNVTQIFRPTFLLEKVTEATAPPRRRLLDELLHRVGLAFQQELNAKHAKV
jgi:hypothetical protein